MTSGLRRGGQEFEQLRFFAFPQNKKIRRERAAEKKSRGSERRFFCTRARARNLKAPTEFFSAENAETFFSRSRKTKKIRAGFARAENPQEAPRVMTKQIMRAALQERKRMPASIFPARERSDDRAFPLAQLQRNHDSFFRHAILRANSSSPRSMTNAVAAHSGTCALPNPLRRSTRRGIPSATRRIPDSVAQFGNERIRTFLPP